MKKLFRGLLYLFSAVLIVSAGSALAADVTIGTLDEGVTLTVNGTNANPSDVFTFDDSNTVTFVSTFGGGVYTDVVDLCYSIDVSVHATNYDGNSGSIYLDTDMGYTPYDIFVITSTNSDDFYIYFDSPPADDAVKVLGLHMMMPNADTYLYALGSSSHSGTPSYLAEVFYGTVENNGTLYIETTTDGSMGSSFNKIVGKRVIFDTSSSGAHDIMIQELYAEYAETDDTEISWWRMELEDIFYCDEYDGYSLNDELPELDTLTDDGMVWFKARNPAKWQLMPLIKANGWDFYNYEYEDYNFWEMQLQGDFRWYNDDNYNEYAHFIGPVLDCESWTWTPYDYLYVNFFGDDDYNNYYDSYRFDGDYGSAGADFWNPLLTTAEPDGYGYTMGSIISPVFLFNVNNGQIGDAYYDTYCALADNQDILILSGTNELNFYEDDGYFYFDQGEDSHWCVENGLTYKGAVPTDDAFDITIVDFDISSHGDEITCVASNNYLSGDNVDSTMYLAYRRKADYGRQFTKVPMTYGETGLWTASVSLPSTPLGEYYFCTVAVENDGDYGKVVEHDVEVRSGADLMIQKTASTNVAPGSALNFTIAISNAGPEIATNVVVTDILPASGLDITGTIEYELGNIPMGGTVTLVITSTVSASTRGWLTNTVSITSDTEDNKLDNNISEVVVWVRPYVVLTVGADPILGFGQPDLPALPATNYPIGQFSLTADSDGVKLDNLAVTISGTYSGLLGDEPFCLFGADVNDFSVAENMGPPFFYLTDMTADNSAIVDHDGYSGDDRGGIAITPDYIYYVGDNNTVRFNAADLSGGVSLPQRDGIFSDLKTGTLYTLWDGSSDPSGSTPFDVTAIRTLNEDLSLGDTIVTLSETLTLGNSGIFAGYGFVILWNSDDGTFYHVDIETGEVTVLGTGNMSYYSAENWAIWGVAERHEDGRYSVVRSVDNSSWPVDGFERMYCDDASTEMVADFSGSGGLSDLACFTYSPWHNRWYFHYEGNSGTFGGSSETLGYADVVVAWGVKGIPIDGDTVSLEGIEDELPVSTRYYWLTANLDTSYSGSIMGTMLSIDDLGLTQGTLAVPVSSFGDLDTNGMVRSSADLLVWKTASTNVNPGADLNFTVTVSNAGPHTATNVVVTDVLPAGLNPSGAIVYNIGDMVYGQTVTFVVTSVVDVATRGWITNTVNVTSDSPDVRLGNNESELAVWVNARVALTVGSNPALGYLQPALPELPVGDYPIGQFSLIADNEGASLSAVSVTLSGTYNELDGEEPFSLYVSESNDFASAQNLISGDKFWLTGMTADNFSIVDHEGLSGDDNGGIAITPDYVYYVGDNNTVRFNAADLSDGVSLPVRDGIFSDLNTGTLYTLWDGVNDPGEISTPFDVAAIRTLNDDLTLGDTIVTLSDTVTMGSSDYDGVFAGYGYVILWNSDDSTFYHVDIASGNVTVLGTGNPDICDSENWAIWGVAERHEDGRYSVVYSADYDDDYWSDGFERMYCDDASTEMVADFGVDSLYDLASFTYSPWHNRWYFHHEDDSTTFGGDSETLGYADATAEAGGLSSVTWEGSTVTFDLTSDSALNAGVTSYFWVTADLGLSYSGTIRGSIASAGDITFGNGQLNVAGSSLGMLNVNQSSGVVTANDFDGDGVTDLCVYDTEGTSPGSWYFMLTSEGYQPDVFGYAGTLPVSGDFDGDGRMDYGVYDADGNYDSHPGMWYLTLSTEGYREVNFGYAGTKPVVGDFDGDGKSDFGVYDDDGLEGWAVPGSWYVMQSSAGFDSGQFGYAGVEPVVGDFDGDGIDDLALYDAEGHAGQPAGSWYFMQSTDGTVDALFGYAGTKPVVGDFDGDGIDDYGVYDADGLEGWAVPGSWYFMESSAGFQTTEFGYAETVPVVGDFDGDGIDDLALYDAEGHAGQPAGSWHFMQSTEGYDDVFFGYEGTVPVIGNRIGGTSDR